MQLLSRELRFPPPESASPDGIVAIGGDLSPERLVLAYSQGIFPWPHQSLPLLWFSPDPRFVIDLNDVHVGRSLRKVIRSGRFEVRADQDFAGVIRGCQASPRPGQEGTWISHDVVAGFEALHELGVAHSVETYLDGELVGGLYGVALGHYFCGESMFARIGDASKVAVVTLLGHLRKWGWPMLDCQVYTDHLARFGAVEWPRKRFLTTLREAVSHPVDPGPLQISMTPAESLDLLQSTGSL